MTQVNSDLGLMPISKLLLKMAPPVMIALLIQSIYNIVDSYFIAKFSQAGLTALSIIFPLQLLMIALGTGTGAGINILVSRYDGEKNRKKSKDVIHTGLFLGVINYVLFAIIATPLLHPFFAMSTSAQEVRSMGITYGKVIFLFSFGLFMESNCTKILQARGNMIVPMAAQIVGAVLNIILDPILIFGAGKIPCMGVMGAAISTVIGQFVAMLLVLGFVLRMDMKGGKIEKKTIGKIYTAGFPSIAMQSLCTLYIIGLNLILNLFTEDAVTVLGIYYKLQTFFFIPLFGLEHIILPIVSYNYGARRLDRVTQTVRYSIGFGSLLLGAGTVIFVLFPRPLLSIFSTSTQVLKIGIPALRIIGVSFIPVAYSSIYSACFQGINRGKESFILTLLRQVFLLVPLAWIFHYWGLDMVWFTFPVTEFLTAACAFIMKRRKRLSVS